MANIIRPSFSFKNLPIYRVKSVGKKTKNVSVPHSLDFTRQVSTVEEAPLDGGKYVRYNESWFNILAQLNAIDALDQYLMKSEEDKGTSAVSNHETTYNHSNFVLSETLENYLLINSEDKGSEAVNSHELEYDHTSFLTPADISNVITEDNIEDFLPDVGISIEDFNPSQFELNSSDKVTLKDGIIPSDISDLTDDGNLIPPHLFFDNQYFSGAGTEIDPKSLRVENLPSGGGGGQKQVELTTTEQGVRDYSLTQWDDGTPINLKNGDAFEIYVDNMVGWGEDDEGYNKSKIYIHFKGLDDLRYIRDGLEGRTGIQDPSGNSDAKFIHLIKFRIYGNRLVGMVFRKGSYSENFAYLFDVGHMDEIEEINCVVLRGYRISLGWNKGVRFIIRKI